MGQQVVTRAVFAVMLCFAGMKAQSVWRAVCVAKPTAGGHALVHRADELPAGYSLVGCTPEEAASASSCDGNLTAGCLGSTMQLRAGFKLHTTDLVYLFCRMLKRNIE